MVCSDPVPSAHLVQVALIAVICDCPAASKVGGFASHSHHLFCPRDMAQKKDLPTVKCFQKGSLYILLSITGLITNCAVAFKEHTNHSHQHLGAKYVKIPTKSACEAFVKNEGMHFTQLSRFPYFDLVCGIVIDPMHNLILGEGLLIITHHHIFTAPLMLIDYLSRTCQVTLLQYLGSMQNTLL